MDTFRFESYQYEQLPSQSSIRLLIPAKNKLNPSQPTLCGRRLLQFSLEVVDLNDPPDFDTLSYANADPIWRLPSDRSDEYSLTNKWPIAVNDRLLFVSKNLYEGLVQLHPLGEPYPGIDDRLTNEYNKTRLIREAELGNHLEVDRLIRLGANLRCVDQFGETALHYAAENGHLETVKVLLRAGAELKMIDHLARTPIDCGIQSKRGQHVEVARLLQNPSQIKVMSTTEIPRLKFGSRLWVDCLCINQYDVEERNTQVAMMSEIYHHASRVVVWLGIDDEVARARRVRALTEHPSSPEFRDGIEDLMNRSYFHRVWTVQELAVAKEIAIFCGSQELTSLNRAILPYIAFRSEIKKRGNAPKCHGGGLRIWIDKHMKDYEQEINAIVPLIRLEEGPEIAQRLPWTTLLAMTWNHESTDTRDKVYSLFGLASTLSSNADFRVDYTLSKAELFLQVGREFIKGDPSIQKRRPPFTIDRDVYYGDAHRRVQGSLRPGDIAGQPLAPLDGLSYNQKAWMNYDNINIPTWCPDFGLHLHAYPADYTRFEATSQMSCDFEVNDRDLLLTSAAMVDEIVDLRELNSRWLADEIQVWIEIASQLDQTYRTGESRLAALVRTIIQDAGRSESDLRKHEFPQPGKERQVLSEIQAALHSEQETIDRVNECFSELNIVHNKIHEDDPFDRFEEEVDRITSNRCLFRTRKGYLGLGLESVAVGDQVYLLAGAHVPHILRPVHNDKVQSRRYRFVGDAYVHGIMFGEAVESDQVDFVRIEIE